MVKAKTHLVPISEVRRISGRDSAAGAWPGRTQLMVERETLEELEENEG